MEYLGSCLCKAVSYTINGTFDSFYLCHCENCRKDTGSAHAANLFSSSAKLIWLKGENNIQRFQVADSNHAKSFCKICGSALPDQQLNGNLLIVPAGSLDSNVDKLPDAHIYISKKANWDESLETVKAYKDLPNI